MPSLVAYFTTYTAQMMVAAIGGVTHFSGFTTSAALGPAQCKSPMHLNGWHVLLWVELWALYATLARCAHCVDVTALDTAASGFIVKRPVFAEHRLSSLATQPS